MAGSRAETLSPVRPLSMSALSCSSVSCGLISPFLFEISGGWLARQSRAFPPALLLLAFQSARLPDRADAWMLPGRTASIPAFCATIGASRKKRTYDLHDREQRHRLECTPFLLVGATSRRRRTSGLPVRRQATTKNVQPRSWFLCRPSDTKKSPRRSGAKVRRRCLPTNVRAQPIRVNQGDGHRKPAASHDRTSRGAVGFCVGKQTGHQRKRAPPERG